jgi:predicted dehydrogenase
MKRDLNVMKPNKSITRRRFLRKSAAAVGAVAAVPYVIPSGVLASPGPNDRIGLGAIGVGRQGTDMMKIVVGCKDARVVAAADASLPRAQAFVAKFGGEPYQDYHKLLDRKDVDAVLHATPEHWHALVCIHACQAGKDVYGEKPLSFTIREGRLMVGAARKHQRVFQTGSHWRSSPPNRFACELIRSGRIGKIKRVVAYNYPSPWICSLPAQPVPQGLDWDLWCGPAKVLPYNIDLFTPRANPGWMSFGAYSNGEMSGWGAHGLDQVQCALGMDESGPIEVWTEGPKFNPPTYTKPESRDRGDKTCSQPKVFFRYAGDIVVELGDGPSGGGRFHGEKGTIAIDTGKYSADPAGLVPEDVKPNRLAVVRHNHVQNWLDCIKSRAKPIADVEIGHRSATVCHLGNIARWTGRRLRWDPVKEVFPDDAEANEYLDRERRKPYELPETG